jgi:ribosomal protein L7/L12
MKMIEYAYQTLLECASDTNNQAERKALLSAAQYLIENSGETEPEDESLIENSGETEPEDESLMLVLVNHGDKKINVIKQLRASFYHFPLKKAKDAVESAPLVLCPMSHPSAVAIESALKHLGAATERLPASTTAGMASVGRTPGTEKNPGHAIPGHDIR